MSVRDPKRESDGFLELSLGINQGTAPNLLPVNQAASAVNTSFRGGWPTPRPGFIKRPLTFSSEEVEAAFKSSLFQTAAAYRDDSRLGSGISMHSGRMFKTNIEDFSVQEITIPGDPNPANIQRAWAIQAENFWLLQDGQSKVFVYNGGSSRRLGANELPVGKQMVYYMGRVGVAMGRQYVFGDAVYGPPTFKDRGTILGMTENTFINQGGAFAVPMDAGDIIGMKPIANINTALGQGPLIVFTEDGIFATVLPTDRTQWQTTTQPIQTIIQLETGGVAQDLLVNVNEDLYFRTDDGIQSLAYAVRNSGQPGNTPISTEVETILASDAQAFLQYGSGVNFNNRMMMTCSPAVSQGHGIYHRGLVVLDFDLISGMRGKLPPAWDGLWTGLNILKIFRVRHKRVMRCFAYVLNSDNEIEFWEITRSDLADNNGTADIPIQWSIDTRSMDFGSKFDAERLFAGDMFHDQMSGQVDFQLQYRPDGYPCWLDWDSWSECAKVSLCAEDLVACEALPNFRPQYRPYHQFKQPADSFDAILKKLYRVGYEFQFRLNITGRTRIKQTRFNAYEEQQLPYGSQLG